MHDSVDQSWYVRPEGVPDSQSAGGVVCRLEQGQVLVALIQERYAGRYVLPKGHVEPGETLEDTAIREIHEESGLEDVVLLKKLGYTERLSFDRSEWKETHYYLFKTEQVQGIPTDPRTLGETRWFPLNELPPLFWPDQQELLEQHRQDIQTELT